jgi:enamine deaminase RidA (YjgF/YER057c/UK114 family)
MKNPLLTRLIKKITSKKGSSNTFKAGIFLLSAALIALSQTGSFLYDKDIAAYKAKFSTEAAVGQPINQSIDCSKLDTKFITDCKIVQHELRRLSSANGLFSYIVQILICLGFFLIGVSAIGFWNDIFNPSGRHMNTTPRRRLISSGSPFEAEMGYSRAVAQGDWVFVSGTTGFDYQTMTIADDVATQADQCLRNIQAALQQAGASLRDVVRVTYVLPNAADFPLCWPVLRQYFGDVRPAAMMITAGLSDPRMKIEIEVTALKSAG